MAGTGVLPDLIDGTDESGWQGPVLADPSVEFVILNVRDQWLSNKMAECRARGIPYGGYAWIDPGASQSGPVAWACARIREQGDPALGLWADYEEDGVAQWQLDEFFRAIDAQGMKGGVYTNFWRVDWSALEANVGWRPAWVAAYPGRNDGTFPGFGGLAWDARGRAQLWQYTSGANSGGAGLDRDVVMPGNEKWYYDFIGGAPVPAPKMGDGDVILKAIGNGAQLADGSLWLDVGSRFLVVDPGNVPTGTVILPTPVADIELASSEKARILASADRVLVEAGELPPPVEGSGLTDEQKNAIEAIKRAFAP